MANTKTTSTPTLTMEDLLTQSGHVLRIPRAGDTVTGTVIEITKKMVLVDVGAKTEGLVVDREFQAAKDTIAELKPGDSVDVFVIDSDNQQGQIILSLQKAQEDKEWELLVAAVESQGNVTVRGGDVNRGGMVVYARGIRGFIPTSQFGRHVSNNLESLVNKDFEVKVLEAEPEKDRLIFSERLVSEADEIARGEKALDQLKVGDKVAGTITGVKPFGAFVAVEVQVPGADGKTEPAVIEGMVHVSEISWEKVDDLTKLYQKGQAVETLVINIDKDQKKLTLSMKQLQDDPWQRLSEECPPGTTVQGKVTRLAPFGVFVNVAPGVDGLIHESKLAGQDFFEGQAVSVVVDSIDSAQRRVSLSPTIDELPVTYK